MLSCGGKNCKTYKYNIMKFIISTDKGRKGNIPFEGAYEVYAKDKSPKKEYIVKEWCADINSLEELMDLVKDLGSIVINPVGYSVSEMPSINLFDEVCGA